jgi:type 1 glutamine amidotransferase
MTRSSYFVPRMLLVMLAAFGLASTDAPLKAQFGSPASAVKLKEPVASRVYQRDINGKAEIPVILDDSIKDGELIEAHVNAGNMATQAIKLVDGKLVGVPVGGPYTITCRAKVGNTIAANAVGPVFVGDLWVLAGQSNMEGVGDLVDVTPPNSRVMLLGSDGKWQQAEEPLHWLVDSPDPVHSGDPKTRAERSAQTHKTRKKGAGLGLPFAVAMVESTGVPVGLVACAHGGTSMAQWSPAKKEEGGGSLYGSMLRQVNLAGGKVKGVLWYQGESDAMGGASNVFPRVFSDFIDSVRSDFGQPELPFYYVQIGRFVNGSDPKGWNAVQDAQRVLVDRVPNTAVIAVIDRELDDGIHVGTQGLKLAGQRLAAIAQRELFGQVGATTPTFDRVSRGPNNTLVVKFKGVNMDSARRVRNSATLGGGMGGMMRGNGASLADSNGIGLRPERHIAGFSIRKDDGTALPLIFESGVGKARDTVILKLSGPLPEKASLWYGYGLDPYCNLVDGSDMAVPVFGPISLDELSATAPSTTAAQASAAPVKVLIIAGDNVSAHNWQATSKGLQDFLEKDSRIKVDITGSPSKDLTDDNLARYDVLLLNYKETPNGPPESRWSDSNKQAFLKAVSDGKGLAVYHFGSSAFTKPNWEEFEKAVAGGWRTQGFHGPAHVFTVKKTDAKHPITDGMSAPEFTHAIDELYQNSMIVSGSVVLATAYSDPNKPRGTGKDEPVIWVNTYGKGRVYENVLGHNMEAMADPKYQELMRRGVIWTATGKVD